MPWPTVWVPSRGVAAVRHLRSFIPECDRIIGGPLPMHRIDAVAGWGRKPTADFSRAAASRLSLPYLSLEDGFLRSVGLGERGAPTISLTLDNVGVHYDGTAPSQLERRLAETGWETLELLERAGRALERLLATGLSKTNAAAPLDPTALPATIRRRVLVVDQTLNDASIRYGLADHMAFERMLHCAMTDEGGAEVVVRRHPATLAGVKPGCLPKALPAGVRNLDGDWRAADVLDRVDAVYTVTSLLGFEGLLRRLPVRCFGLPFYAGWGATRDEVSSIRRGRRRTPLELFAAAYLLHSRYVDPLTGEACGIETAMERLLAFRRRSDLDAGYTACIGFAPVKRASTAAFLCSARGETAFHGSETVAVAAAARRQGRVAVWASRETATLDERCKAAGVPLVRIEDGFIRSRGLGSDLVPGASIVLDDLGVHYDPSGPSRLRSILLEQAFSPELLARAAALRRALLAAGVTKYNVGGSAAEPPAGSARRLLVLGQVDDDASVLRGGGGLDNLGLLRWVRRDNPDALIAYKPHPDVEAGNRRGSLAPRVVLREANAIHAEVDLLSALAMADEVCTLTSLGGFEALLRGLPVTTYGDPFYAGWGLTQDRAAASRGRMLSLDELIAGALILYPRYLHPASHLPCEVEDVVRSLALTPLARRTPRWLSAVRATLARSRQVPF